MRLKLNKYSTQTGFTIVELLIVIVVIAILAAITIVTYNGIQDRSKDSAVQADLRNLAVRVSEYAATTNVNLRQPIRLDWVQSQK